MKLTWFGGTTLRIHTGGKILVVDPAAPAGVDPDELVSGADVTFALGEAGEAVDPVLWQPRRQAAMLDAEDLPEVVVHGLAEGGALIAAAGEPPLLLLHHPLPKAGRWTRDAVVVVLGDDAPALAAAALESLAPKLIAIAAPEAVADACFAALGTQLGGTGMVALEAGLAVEL
ncbi:hypothetical protein [Devosia sp.]|uniref:hypothetical protein n=1 Tax=Devosia sp. TaxID=1871048 RepID=UPI003A8FCE32